MSIYLSRRKDRKNPEKIFLYAVENIWDKEIKTIKKKQKYLGFYLDGALNLDRELFING